MSRSGFYDARARPPSTRAIRHAWLTDQIAAIHDASGQTYGGPRVHAELVHGHGIVVGHNTIALLTARAGLAGLPLRRRAKRIPTAVAVTDLVRRDFRRHGPNQLWVTDITEHPTREDKLYCCVVLDVYSRRVVGWAIDSRQRADLATSALGMAIDSRAVGGQLPGEIIHGDHGTQFTSVLGRDPALRARCHTAALSYVMAVPVDLPLVEPSGRATRPDRMLATVGKAVWERRSCGQGTKGARCSSHGWRSLPRRRSPNDGAERERGSRHRRGRPDRNVDLPDEA